MKYMFSYSRLPDNSFLIENINEASSRLHKKLKALEIDKLPISDYNRRYLKSKFNSLVTNLQLYSYILSWAIYKYEGDLNNLSLVDYGGGTGFISLLAKELGVGKVIYNDIYDVSCIDAKIIAESVGNVADKYVHGDIGDVITYIKNNNIVCDAITSYDVIEHVYDIKSFFNQISQIPNKRLSIVMSSGANNNNPYIKNQIIKKHIQIEYVGKEKTYGHKERDCNRAFYDVRKEIIENYLKRNGVSLADFEIKYISKNTRGKMEGDIYSIVEEYLKTGKIEYNNDHPTNTCDPYTGNWEEKLLDPYILKEYFKKSGFDANVLSGYYGTPRSNVKRLLAKIFNTLIYINQDVFIRIAPFYTIYAIRNG